MSAEFPEISRIRVPATLDSADSREFTDIVELANVVQRRHWGSDDFGRGALQELATSRPNPYEERIILAARRRGLLVGRVVIDVPLTDNLSTCYVDVMVHPDHRREGVGAALYAEAERTVRGLGRSIIMGWSEEPVRDAPVHGSVGDDSGNNGGDALVPATGAGSYPRNTAPAAMALNRGFTLAQVDRCSVLDLARTPLPVRDAHDRAAAAAGPEYTVLQWAERCPDEYVDQYAQLRQAMSTDAPLGELALDEEAWDAERVRGDEARLREGGGRSLVSAALHRPSGTLAGHTVLESRDFPPAVAVQEDTLVLRAHRGHRLGMLLKTANLLAVGTHWPHVERVYTWNAEENRPMLAVNESLGFVPAGWVGAWQKRLDQPGGS